MHIEHMILRVCLSYMGSNVDAKYCKFLTIYEPSIIPLIDLLIHTNLNANTKSTFDKDFLRSSGRGIFAIYIICFMCRYDISPLGDRGYLLVYSKI